MAGGVGGTGEEAGGVEKRAQAAQFDADHYRHGDAGPPRQRAWTGGGRARASFTAAVICSYLAAVLVLRRLVLPCFPALPPSALPSLDCLRRA
jgi:hypothetical protein